MDDPPRLIDASQTHRFTGLSPAGAGLHTRDIASEVPVAISVCGFGYAVMMASPADLEDFAWGFALSERLIDRADQIERVEVRPEARGILLDLWLTDDCRERVIDRVRHRVGESSCGLCGIENLDQALRPLPALAAPADIGPRAVFAALASLRDHQPLNALTGAVHAAAFADAEGTILAAREDVGRHNAFDKLIGHALRTGLAPGAGFALLTSRCSFELVEKAALVGVRLLVTISAPTALAIERANACGLTLIALARADEMLVAADPHTVFTSA
ncbi:formate dehydrogenase accessory sulfurtransferase FdhD [Novosphingobium sp. Gsoil 351]|uniref:formate dehydrogenase accessory sulfurtransferase FdhD n=1 Tax=Novosphingobium sp. Gsoil 351 TaxID=2675225 RepID=UPI001E53DB1B|nr:formate dehydrogenase accessory sulfurtransferase FdhD [Novosphingobium sp. Gsoil 351]